MKPKKTNTHERQVVEQGREAWLRGAPLTANPYIDGTGDANLWALGWMEKNREPKGKKAK